MLSRGMSKSQESCQKDLCNPSVVDIMNLFCLLNFGFKFSDFFLYMQKNTMLVSTYQLTVTLLACDYMTLDNRVQHVANLNSDNSY